MEQKLKTIILWLKKIFENECIPEFEVNEKNVDILYEIVDRSEAADRDAALLVEDMEERAMQYEAQYKYFNTILTESLCISPFDLSRKGMHYLEVLADCAKTLETKDTSLASLFCATNDLSLELYQTESKNEELALNLGRMRKNLSALVSLEQQLTKDLKNTEEQLEIDKARIDRRCHNLKFLGDKSEDLKVRIKAAEEKLVAQGLNYSLMHDSLISLSEKLAAMEEELASIKSEMEILEDMPLSISLAKVKIEEVKRELEATEAQLTSEIDKITFEITERVQWK